MKCEWPNCDNDSVVSPREHRLTGMPRYCASHLYEAGAYAHEAEEGGEDDGQDRGDDQRD